MDITMMQTTQIPAGLGALRCGRDLGVIWSSARNLGDVRDHGVVLGFAGKTPGSLAWRLPIT